MRVLERLRNIDEHRHDIEVTLAAELAQICAGGELHGQRDEIAFAIRRLHLQDGRMIEPARDGVLAHQRGPRRIVVSEAGIQNLESDVDTHGLIARAPDFRLPASTQLLEHRVAGGDAPSVRWGRGFGPGLTGVEAGCSTATLTGGTALPAGAAVFVAGTAGGAITPPFSSIHN